VIDVSDNLQPVRSKEEARQRGKQGGIKSGEARRKKKTIREELEILLELMEEGQTNREIVSAALLMKAKKGDTKAFELLRDTVGEKPIDKQDIFTTTVELVVGEEDAMDKDTETE